MSTPTPTDRHREEADRIARSEYLDDDRMHTAQYPKMRCRVCRDRNALRDEIAEALAAAEARGREEERDALKLEVEKLRGSPEPGPYPACSDCGRAMVWSGREGSPAWMCPECVYRRLRSGERVWGVTVRNNLDAESLRIERDALKAEVARLRALFLPTPEAESTLRRQRQKTSPPRPKRKP